MDRVIDQPIIRINTLTSLDYSVDARCSYEWQKNKHY